MQKIARLADHAATELYFASGVFVPGQQQPTISYKQQERFYRELTPIIDRLSSIGIASSVHHLVEMLEVYIPTDPRAVFLQVAALIESGRSRGYHYESIALSCRVPAVAASRTVLKVKPDLPGIHEAIANSLLRLGNQLEALKEFEAELQIQPRSASVHTNVGQLLMTMGKDDQAREMLSSPWCKFGFVNRKS